MASAHPKAEKQRNENVEEAEEIRHEIFWRKIEEEIGIACNHLKKKISRNRNNRNRLPRSVIVASLAAFRPWKPTISRRKSPPSIPTNNHEKKSKAKIEENNRSPRRKTSEIIEKSINRKRRRTISYRRKNRRRSPSQYQWKSKPSREWS